MIKAILVAAKGDERDPAVFATAFSLANLLQAHLDFYHVWITPDRAAALEPYVDFAQGRALKDALDRLQRDAETRSTSARRLTLDFCTRNNIPIADSIGEIDGVSASFLEETDDVVNRFLFQARSHDLIVVGRPQENQGFHRNLIEELLLSCGRPVVVAPSVARELPIGVAVLGWKDTREAARALSAAMPILAKCRRVIITNVDDGEPARYPSLDVVARLLARHEIPAETQTVRAEGRTVAQSLHAAAQAAHADLLVVGAYGHSRIRELIFGGVTQSFLEGASLPVFLLH